MKTFEEALQDYTAAHNSDENDPASWLRKYDAIKVEALKSHPTIQLLASISVKSCMGEAIKDGFGHSIVFDAMFWAFISGITIGMEMEKTEAMK